MLASTDIPTRRIYHNLTVIYGTLEFTMWRHISLTPSTAVIVFGAVALFVAVTLFVAVPLFAAVTVITLFTVVCEDFIITVPFTVIIVFKVIVIFIVRQDFTLVYMIKGSIMMRHIFIPQTTGDACVEQQSVSDCRAILARQ